VVSDESVAFIFRANEITEIWRGKKKSSFADGAVAKALLSEDGGSRFLGNADNLPDYMASYPKRQQGC
jgi:hypothetical protein